MTSTAVCEARLPAAFAKIPVGAEPHREQWPRSWTNSGSGCQAAWEYGYSDKIFRRVGNFRVDTPGLGGGHPDFCAGMERLEFFEIHISGYVEGFPVIHSRAL